MGLGEKVANLLIIAAVWRLATGVTRGLSPEEGRPAATDLRLFGLDRLRAEAWQRKKRSRRGPAAGGEEGPAGHPGQSGDVGGAPGRSRPPRLRPRRAGAAGGRAADGHPGAGGGGRLPFRDRHRARRRLGAGRPPPRRMGGRHGLARAGPGPRGARGRRSSSWCWPPPWPCPGSSSRAPAGSGRRWPMARERRRTAAISRRIRRARSPGSVLPTSRPGRGPESQQGEPQGRPRLPGAGRRRLPGPAASLIRLLTAAGKWLIIPLVLVIVLAALWALSRLWPNLAGLAGEDGGALAGSPEPPGRPPRPAPPVRAPGQPGRRSARQPGGPRAACRPATRSSRPTTASWTCSRAAATRGR